MSSAPNRVREARAFIVANHGRAAFAPFTGQDHRAWAAFALLLDLYIQADEPGRACAIGALRNTLLCAQPHVWGVFRATIPFAGDWSDEAPLWNAITAVPIAFKPGSDHVRDEDCTLGDDLCCIVCGVTHAIPCSKCTGRGFHRDDCPEIEELMRAAESKPIEGPRLADSAELVEQRREQETICRHCHRDASVPHEIGCPDGAFPIVAGG